MRLVLIQLSDIHISTKKYPNNPILKRGIKLLGAIGAMFLQDVDGIILLVNGDVAYAGLVDEYNLAYEFIEAVRTGLTNLYPKAVLHSAFLPGNHDLDFDKDNDARRQLIVDPNLAAFGDGSIINICTSVQDNFFDFCQRCQGRADKITGVERLYYEHNYKIGGEEVVVRVLNSAWDSQIKEKPGTLLMPVAVLQNRLTKNNPASVVLTAIHHPYKWYEPNNSRALKEVLESSSDVIFTGHEHVAESYTKTGSMGEHNEYIEAGPLQENGSPENSEFNVVAIDTGTQSYVVNHFAWEDDMYQLVNDPVGRPFIRNNSRLQREFDLQPDFARELNETDTPFQHPFKDPVTLDDIFVYPNFREYSALGASKEAKKTKPSGGRGPYADDWSGNKESEQSAQQVVKRVIKGRDILGHVLAKRRVMVSGPDKSGRTSISRIIFRDLWKNGRMPLYLSVGDLDQTNINQFPKYLDRCFAKQYRSPKAARYWQLDKEDRAVILDDYHKLPNVRVLREKLLNELNTRFGSIVIVGGTQMRIQELVGTEAASGILSDFDHVEIMGFGHQLKSELIHRWFILGREGQLSDDEVERQTNEMEKLISMILDRGLLPPYPSYVLLLIQQLELRRPIDTASASYGKLFEAFLRLWLEKRKIESDTGFGYLSELAYEFFSKKIDSLDDQSAVQWHNRYVEKYKNPIDYVRMRDDLVRAGVLAHTNGAIRFRVKAAFYFFVANYFDAHLNQGDNMARFKELTTKLYREDAANIVLFLCHLSKDPAVMGEVLASANRLFDEVPETDLFDDLKFTGNLIAKLPERELEEGNPRKRRQQLLEERDAIEARSAPQEDPNDDMYAYRHEEETEHESEIRRQMGRLNAAYKTIQITGQILRSFAGSMTGDQKKLLALACYSLGLRLLRYIFDVFKLAKDDFGASLKERFIVRSKESAKDPKDVMTDEQATALANATIFLLVEMCVYGVVRHIALAIGVEKLGMVFKEILQEKNTIAVRTIDLAIELEHFVQFPEKTLLALFNEVKDNLMMQSVLRDLTWDRIYYFKTPYDVRDKVCKKIGIKMLPSAMDPDQKKGS
jgi:hypothetical protein